MKMVRDFILLVSKVTADGNWSHEIKRRLLLGRKTMIQPWQQIEKQRHYFANKVPSSQSYSFSSSHVKKAEHRRNDAFELWCWRRLLRVPWTARRSNQSILKEISPEYSLKGLMLKLKLQYFGHLMQRTNSFEKTLMLGKIEGWRRRGWQRMRWLDGITDSMTWVWVNSGSWWGTGRPGVLLHGVAESDTTEQLNWTDLLSTCMSKRN